MQGRSAETLRAARELAENAPPAMIKQMPDMETAPAAPIAALARFGRWDEVLRESAPPREWPYARGVWHYARGLAHNARGQAAEARRELAELELAKGEIIPELRLVGPPAHGPLQERQSFGISLLLLECFSVVNDGPLDVTFGFASIAAVVVSERKPR